MWHHRLQRRIRFSYWNELCVAKKNIYLGTNFILHIKITRPF